MLHVSDVRLFLVTCHPLVRLFLATLYMDIDLHILWLLLCKKKKKRDENRFCGKYLEVTKNNIQKYTSIIHKIRTSKNIAKH